MKWTDCVSVGPARKTALVTFPLCNYYLDNSEKIYNISHYVYTQGSVSQFLLSSTMTSRKKKLAWEKHI